MKSENPLQQYCVRSTLISEHEGGTEEGGVEVTFHCMREKRGLNVE
jgi:hypothetical protein